MELPIRIVIVLFVAVAVGALVIFFSNQVLDQARNDITQWSDDPAMEEKVVQLGEAADQEIINLANECVRRNVAENFDEEICFAVFATTWPDWAAMSRDLRNEYTLDTTRVETAIANGETITAVKIIYDPLGYIRVEP